MGVPNTSADRPTITNRETEFYCNITLTVIGVLAAIVVVGIGIQLSYSILTLAIIGLAVIALTSLPWIVGFSNCLKCLSSLSDTQGSNMSTSNIYSYSSSSSQEISGSNRPVKGSANNNLNQSNQPLINQKVSGFGRAVIGSANNNLNQSNQPLTKERVSGSNRPVIGSANNNLNQSNQPLTNQKVSGSNRPVKGSANNNLNQSNQPLTKERVSDSGRAVKGSANK